MILLKNFNQKTVLPAIDDTNDEFIKYTINKTLWLSLPTSEISTMEKVFLIVDDETYNEYRTKDIIIHWEANFDTCINI